MRVCYRLLSVKDGDTVKKQYRLCWWGQKKKGPDSTESLWTNATEKVGVYCSSSEVFKLNAGCSI